MHQSQLREDREDPWQGSTPKWSIVELPSQDASPIVLTISKMGAILTPVCSCNESSGCSIGKSRLSRTRQSLCFLKSYQVRASSVYINSDAQFFDTIYM